MADITRELSGLTDRFVAYRFVRLIERGKLDMSRLEEKLAKAAGVVGRQTAKIEARADSLIAREDEIEKRTDAVFTPHESILSTAERGLDGLEDKLRLMSNGDPLQASVASPAAPEPPAIQQPGSTASTEPGA